VKHTIVNCQPRSFIHTGTAEDDGPSSVTKATPQHYLSLGRGRSHTMQVPEMGDLTVAMPRVQSNSPMSHTVHDIAGFSLTLDLYFLFIFTSRQDMTKDFGNIWVLLGRVPVTLASSILDRAPWPPSDGPRAMRISGRLMMDILRNQTGTAAELLYLERIMKKCSFAAR
jgi:hypothetical protein